MTADEERLDQLDDLDQPLTVEEAAEFERLFVDAHLKRDGWRRDR